MKAPITVQAMKWFLAQKPKKELNKIKTIARFRPLNISEQGEPQRRERGYKASSNVIAIPCGKYGETNFKFDRVFHESAKTEEIFQETKYLVDDALKGNNCTIFAYGQTGSGKTYTMLGDGETKGISQLSFKHLYDLIELDAARFNTKVVVTMV